MPGDDDGPKPYRNRLLGCPVAGLGQQLLGAGRQDCQPRDALAVLIGLDNALQELDNVVQDSKAHLGTLGQFVIDGSLFLEDGQVRVNDLGADVALADFQQLLAQLRADIGVQGAGTLTGTSCVVADVDLDDADRSLAFSAAGAMQVGIVLLMGRYQPIAEINDLIAACCLSDDRVYHEKASFNFKVIFHYYYMQMA